MAQLTEKQKKKLREQLDNSRRSGVLKGNLESNNQSVQQVQEQRKEDIYVSTSAVPKKIQNKGVLSNNNTQRTSLATVNRTDNSTMMQRVQARYEANMQRQTNAILYKKQNTQMSSQQEAKENSWLFSTKKSNQPEQYQIKNIGNIRDNNKLYTPEQKYTANTSTLYKSPTAESVNDELVFNIANKDNAKERAKIVNSLVNSKKEQQKLYTKVENYARQIKAQKDAENINNDLKNGKIGSSVGHVAKGLPTGAVNTMLNIGGTIASLNPNMDDNMANTAKSLANQYAQTNAQIDNGIVRKAGTVSHTIGNMLPAMAVGGAVGTAGATGALASNAGGIVNAISSGTSSYLDTLDEEQTNKLNSFFTGVANGILTFGTEKVTGGNLITKGSLDDVVAKGISKKITNSGAQWLASKVYEFGGEIAEENLENLAGYLIDDLINNKKVSAEQIKEDFKRTSEDTFWTTLVLNALGLGGNTYNDVKNISNIQKANNEVIDNSNLSEEQKASLKRVAEKHNMTTEEVQNLINNPPQENLQQTTQNQATELANNEVINNNQQITQEQNKITQNGNMGQITANEDLRVKIPGSNYKFEASGNQKVDNFRKDASQHFNNSEKARNYISMIEKIITDKNIDIRLDANLKTPDGKIANGSYSNGVITINPNSTKAGEFIAVHELTHAIGTKNMLNMVENYRKSNKEFDNAVQNLLNNYKSTELTEEALSDVSAQLFGNQEFINNVAQNNPNIFQKIYNEIKYLWHQFTGYKNQDQFIEDLYYKWTQAYNSNNKLNDTSRFDIVTNGNKKYVKATRQVITGTNPLIWEQQVEDYINEKIRNGEDVQVLTDDGDILSITEDTAGKAKFRNEVIDKNGNKRRLNNKEFMAKLRAETHIDELGEISTHKQGPVPDTKAHSFAKDGFTYRTAYFEDIDSQYYKITMSVGKNGDINTIYNIGKMQNAQKNRRFSISELKGSSGKTTSDRSSSINSIPSSNQDVNTTTKYSIQESENNSGSFNLKKNRFDVSGNENLANSQTLFYRTREDGQYYVQATDGSGKITYDGVFYGEKQLAKSLGEEIAKKIVNTSESINNEIYLQSDNIKSETDYMMAHRPTETGAYASNITKGTGEWDSLMPEDVYEHPEWYFDMNQEYSKESFKVLKQIKNNPNAEITIYRATTGNKINKGDWVTLSKKYAEYHNNSQFKGKGNIIELKVKAKDVQYAGDDINEFGYFPQTDIQTTNNTDIRFSQNNETWQEYLDKNYKKHGTTTKFEEITQKNAQNEGSFLLPQNPKKNVSMPMKMETFSEMVPQNPVKIRKHYDSIIKSKYTSDEARKIAKEMMGIDTYVPETNEGQLQQADERIKSSSPQAELSSLMSRSMSGGKIDSIDIAVGERLIQYYSKTGNSKKLRDAIHATALAGTSAGQTVQAMSLLNHQTPEGQAIWIERSIEKLNKELAKKKGGTIQTDENGNVKIVDKRGKDITDKVPIYTLTDEMMSTITNSTKENLQENLDKVYEELGQQVPKTLAEQIDSWRYFSMLANFRTHVRNIVGNLTMSKTQAFKNKLSGIIEGVVSKVNPEMERTHTVVSSSKEVKQFAKNDIKNVEDRLGLNDNKYNPKTRLQNNQRTFKSNIAENTLGTAFNLNDKALEAEDGWGLKACYSKALAEYMTANKLTPENITDAQLGKARNYAIEEAKEATFHQENAVASAITQFSKKNKVTKFIVDSALPFVKTPMNVAYTAVEYSPIGLGKTLVKNSIDLRKGNITVNQYIDNISKGLTGSGITFLGYVLAEAGILKASGDDDDKLSKFESDQGKQSYSIQIGDNTYSLDWLAPLGIPLFIGAELHALKNAKLQEKSSISNDDNTMLNQVGKSAGNLFNALATAMNPMTEMSMLSGLTSTLSSYEENKLAGIMTNMSKSYVNQFVPTALGQVAKVTDDYERSTTSTKTGLISKTINQTANQIKAKIPGLRKSLPVKTDIWGDEQKTTEDIYARAFETFIAPYTRKEIKDTALNKALSKLYKDTGEASVLPSSIEKDMTIDKQKYRYTDEEYANAKKEYGKNAKSILTELTTSNNYNKMSDTEKVTAISDVYSYVKEKLKKNYADDNKLELKTSTLYDTVTELKDRKVNISSFFQYNAQTKEMKKDIEKVKYLSELNTDSKTKDIIYRDSLMSKVEEGKTTEYEELKEYYANNSVLGSKNYRSYDIIDQYLDYKVKASNKLQELKTKGTASKDSNKLNDIEATKLLVDSKYTNPQKEALYVNVVASDTNKEKYEIVKQMNGGNKISTYLEYVLADKESDKEDDGTKNGKTISGTKKKKVVSAIQSTKLNEISKIYLLGTEYDLNTNTELSNYYKLKNYLKTQSESDQLRIVKTLKRKTEMKDGTYTW